MVSVSKRLENLPVSAVRRLSPYANAAKREGVKVYHLNIGDPDIVTPKVMLETLKKWDLETIGYAPSPGVPSLLDSLKFYYQRLGYKKINEENMVVTVGGSEAVIMSFFAVASPGEEIIVFEPFYSNYTTCANFCGVKLTAVPTTIKEGFHLPAEREIEKRVTNKTRAILFCSPNNPTGAIYSKKELEILVNVAKKHNLFLISDEVYREFSFEGKKVTSVLDFLEKIPEQIILLDSLSKRYSLCGARIGILASLNKEVIKGVIKIAQGRLSAPLIEQVIASKLTKVPSSYTIAVTKEYRKRRDVLYKGLLKIQGVFLTKPEGAFYTMVSLPVKNAEDFAIFLLEKFRLNNETVMLAPGSGFYSTPGEGLNQVRIAYVLKVEDLKKSIKIIEEGLKQYQINLA